MTDRPLRIALQGELGSFSDEAIQQHWGADAERLPYRDFADVTTSVASGVADRGILPIENTIVGDSMRRVRVSACRVGRSMATSGINQSTD